MRLPQNQLGFSAGIILLIVVVVGILGFAGYTVYNRQQDKTTTSSVNQSGSEQPATSNDVQSAPEINSTKDLDKAQATLDQADPSTSNDKDVSQLDAELSGF